MRLINVLFSLRRVDEIAKTPRMRRPCGLIYPMNMTGFQNAARADFGSQNHIERTESPQEMIIVKTMD